MLNKEKEVENFYDFNSSFFLFKNLVKPNSHFKFVNF